MTKESLLKVSESIIKTFLGGYGGTKTIYYDKDKDIVYEEIFYDNQMVYMGENSFSPIGSKNEIISMSQIDGTLKNIAAKLAEL